MATLLQLDSSADSVGSVTRRLTARFADAWRSQGPDHQVVVHDLHADPLPHLESDELHWPPERRRGDPIPAGAEALQRGILDELLAADVVLIGAPMYNYSMPSTLKAWIDRIHVPDVTAASVQPMAGRHAVIVTASGGAYDDGTPTAGWDHAVPPLEIILGSALGMTVDVVAVRLTLAGRMPALVDSIPRGQEELALAEAAIDELAARLG